MDKPKKPVKTISRKTVLEALDQIPMESIIKGEGKKRSLTKKQEGFIRDVALGKPKAEAYRNNYNTKTNKQYQGNQAFKLASNPTIANEIEAFKVALKAQEYQSSTHLKAFIMHQLTLHALNEDNPPASRIRSLELLGKSYDVGLFEDRKVITNISQSSEVKSKLINQIKSMLSNQQSITDVVIDDGDSLLSELKGKSQIEMENSAGDEMTPTPQMLVRGGMPDMHSIPHTQSQENNEQCVTTTSNTLENANVNKTDLQAIDLKEENIASVNVYSYRDENDSQQGGGGIEKLLEDADKEIGNTPVNDLKSKG